MPAFAGFTTTVKVPGAAVAFTGEATTNLTGKTYQINTSAKRILDPAAAIVVKDGGTPIAESGIAAVDWFLGKVTLVSVPGGAVTVDASYRPMLPVLLARSASVDVGLNSIDGTTFDDVGEYRGVPGEHTASGEFQILDMFDTDLDSGGGVVKLQTLLTGRTVALVEYGFNTGASFFRAWALLEGLMLGSTPADLVAGTAKWMLAAQQSVSFPSLPAASFGFA